jgi:hypothetical protein
VASSRKTSAGTRSVRRRIVANQGRGGRTAIVVRSTRATAGHDFDSVARDRRRLLLGIERASVEHTNGRADCAEHGSVGDPVDLDERRDAHLDPADLRQGETE